MRTAIITSYYINLHGTRFGGRNGRDYHYLDSFRSLLKMSNADFFVFCDESNVEALRNVANEFPDTKVEIIPYDLNNFYMKELFERYKNIHEAMGSNRCQEIQYSKTKWIKDISEQYDYDYYYWIDIGISHSGLIPDKFMIVKPDHDFECFDNTLITNKFLEGLNEYTDDKVFIIAKRNDDVHFYRWFLHEEFYRDPKSILHVIGGIVGGRKEQILWFHDEFMKTAKRVTEKTGVTHDEEEIYNIIFNNYPEKFNDKYFELWYHEDNVFSFYSGDERRDEIIRNAKSFYKLLEELNREN